MKEVTLLNYERDKDSFFSNYVPGSAPSLRGYIKLARDGSVIDEEKVDIDDGEAYYRMAKTHLNCMWNMEPLPIKSIIFFD